ncbi:alpha/beta hydrolase [Mycolicibacterium novocastrense]|uniref:Alpha/beta hydrolase n=1 Tax=Mycolicibacterium novocastrense TaxID=59813 RepID=A0AAW5SIM4_MYCNV|nr:MULTISPECIES: alpha/beta hydrolase [Mycolicibacterium]MCV7023658.1 alpha/beta hydrolase [Mycolicibacterium novocastrense]MDX1886895.1 alpha/beta hydrolase [Mycolicibacterium sp. 120270]GAT07696.1 alpha/beta hydrolase [Mycolicibacterium novocastrense]
MIHCADPTATQLRPVAPASRLRPIRGLGNESTVTTVTTTDGVQLAVRDYGPRDAEHTVVLLHGFCLSADSWSGQIAYLLRRYGQRIRIVAYDHRGHGQSSQAPIGTYGVATLAADLAEVLTSLNVTGRLTLVGHSMGGFTALAYYARPAADRPVEPQGLVLVATAAGRLGERGLGRLLAIPATAALVGLINHTPAQALKALSGPLCAGLGRWRGAAGAPRATLAALAAAALATTPVPTIIGFLPALANYDTYPVLADIRAHTVVISGGADLLTPPAHARELAAAIPGATHIHLHDAGHMLPQEAPHITHEAIRRAMFPTAAVHLVDASTSRHLGRTSHAR